MVDIFFKSFEGKETYEVSQILVDGTIFPLNFEFLFPFINSDIRIFRDGIEEGVYTLLEVGTDADGVDYIIYD